MQLDYVLPFEIDLILEEGMNVKVCTLMANDSFAEERLGFVAYLEDNARFHQFKAS
jgi:hypothetical protein